MRANRVSTEACRLSLHDGALPRGWVARPMRRPVGPSSRKRVGALGRGSHVRPLGLGESAQGNVCRGDRLRGRRRSTPLTWRFA